MPTPLKASWSFYLKKTTPGPGQHGRGSRRLNQENTRPWGQEARCIFFPNAHRPPGGNKIENQRKEMFVGGLEAQPPFPFSFSIFLLRPEGPWALGARPGGRAAATWPLRAQARAVALRSGRQRPWPSMAMAPGLKAGRALEGPGRMNARRPLKPPTTRRLRGARWRALQGPAPAQARRDPTPGSQEPARPHVFC